MELCAWRGRRAKLQVATAAINLLGELENVLDVESLALVGELGETSRYLVETVILRGEDAYEVSARRCTPEGIEASLPLSPGISGHSVSVQVNLP